MLAMSAARNTSHNEPLSTVANGFSYSTSAIETNTEKYIYLPSDKTESIILEDVGRYSVFEIANWFLSKSEMTHKKLQKLCYYAQAWCYALKGYRLANTDFQAWVHGPVSPALWERFKSFGFNTIRIQGRPQFRFSEEILELLENVWDTYGDKTGNALEALSHREPPWREARRGYGPNENCSIVISPQAMSSYYRSIYCGD